MVSKEANMDVKALEKALSGFGRYGNEDLKWRILDVDGDKALIISEKGIDAQKFNPRSGGNVWSGSEIRTWLNESFFKTAFNDAERASILSTSVETESVSSEDKVFLLSYSEVETYFPSNEEKVLSPTAYAKDNGARLKGDAACWWLRTPAADDNFAMCVYYSGDVCALSVAKSDILVRPALWVKLSEEMLAERENAESFTENDNVEMIKTDSGEIGVIFGYLKVFPKDLGKNFKKVPVEIIDRVNSSRTYGYDTWRLPTDDELRLLAENGFIKNADDYMSEERKIGAVRLVTDKNTAAEIAAEEAKRREEMKRLEEERLNAERLEAERRSEAERLRRAKEEAERERLEDERRAQRAREEEEEREGSRKKRNKIIGIVITLLILAGGGIYAAMTMGKQGQKPESGRVAAERSAAENRKKAEKSEKAVPKQKSEPEQKSAPEHKVEPEQNAGAEQTAEPVRTAVSVPEAASEAAPEQTAEPVKKAESEKKNESLQKQERKARAAQAQAEAARKAQERKIAKAQAEEEKKAKKEEQVKAQSDEARKAELERMKAGFGNYNGAIKWRVLAYDGGKALLISDRGIAAHRFDASSGNWAGSEIRKWLNGAFYSSAFSDEEKSKITAHPATGDKVFLLSKSEAELYFPGKCSRLAYPTAAAKSKAYISTSTSYCSGGSEGAVFWWLRTAGSTSNYAMSVSFDGSIGDFEAHNPDFVVRPAVWVIF